MTKESVLSELHSRSRFSRLNMVVYSEFVEHYLVCQKMIARLYSVCHVSHLKDLVTARVQCCSSQS